MNPATVPSTMILSTSTTKRGSVLSSILSGEELVKFDNFLLDLDQEPVQPCAVPSSTFDVMELPPIDFVSIKPMKRLSRQVSDESSATAASTVSSMSSVSCDDDYEETVVGPYDVLCGREANSWNNEGNQRFRAIISQSVPRYNAARTTSEKTAVVKSVVRELQGENGKGRFLKQSRNGRSLRELSKRETHQKVGKSIRDLVKQLAQRNDNGESTKIIINKPAQFARRASIVSIDISNMTEEDDVWGMKFYHLD